MEKPLYFAYGSNINLDQMRYRCPDATVYGQAVLDNYDLRFRGSGVATVEPKEGACVYGLLWELTDKCEASLDRYGPLHVGRKKGRALRCHSRQRQHVCAPG